VPARELKQVVTDRSACDFYHVMEFPDGSITAEAQWDLRSTVDDYLGPVNFSRKRVLEIGPASGFLSFHMERKDAEVTCIEPPLDSLWDFVPYAGIDLASERRPFCEHIARIRNSFWYAHQAFGSRVRMFEADAARLPASLGTFDIGLLGCVLLHCCSPVQIMASLARRVTGTMIVTDMFVPDIPEQPLCLLIPDASNDSFHSWWYLSPQFVVQFLGVLGFTATSVRRHKHLYSVRQTWTELFTVVATRTA
jgi:SAM-dependent methyltransferase